MVEGEAVTAGWLPPYDPYSLVQSSLVPNEWLVLLSCILLNMTTRKQVDRVLPELLKQWPTAGLMSLADPNDVEDIIRPLGFGTKRSHTIIEFSRAYLEGHPEVSELPGIGEYARSAHRIFCLGLVDREEPSDHALRYVHRWLVRRKSCR